MTTPSRHSRTLGALLGVHAGDSLGATLEFLSWDEIIANHPSGLHDIVGGGHFGWPAGHATDDTDLTRAVLLAYRDVLAIKVNASAAAGSKVPVQKYPFKEADVVLFSAQNMVDWYDGRWPDRVRGESPRDIGGATAIGISRFKASHDVFNCGAGEGKAGNGSLMRCIPTALFRDDLSELVRESVAISAITHDDKACVIACAVYNATVKTLMEGKSAEEAWQQGKDAIAMCTGSEPDVKTKIAADRVAKAMDAGKTLVTVKDLAENGPKKAANGPKVLPFKGAGYVLESLIIAVAALFDQRSLEEVLVDVVRIGKDTDTNGAIAGGLLGARDGVDAIPLRWREKLQFGAEFEEIVDFMLSHQEVGGSKTS